TGRLALQRGTRLVRSGRIPRLRELSAARRNRDPDRSHTNQPGDIMTLRDKNRFQGPTPLRGRRALLAQGAVGVAATAVPFIRNAHAQQVIDVTFIAGFPPGATFVGSFVNGYVQHVDAELAKTG